MYARRRSTTAATSWTPRASTSSSDASTTGSVKTAPVEARIAFGFQTSACASATISASAPAASAERAIAPRLPGFSIPTETR